MEREVLLKNISVCGTSKSHTGFSLIEILVALAIMSIMALVLVPRLKVRGHQPIDQLVEHIVSLSRMGYERAILTGKTHRVYFFFRDPARISLEVIKDDKSTTGEWQFASAAAAYAPVTYPWDLERFTVLNFYIKNIDEARNKGLKDAWFFVLPQGVSQEVIINIRDEVTSEVRGLVLNPFTVQFTVYDAARKP